ncbi:MAG: DNA primase [Candidatus Moranbacteria bacterium]|nr:DNA primase [Candidatus Moranbacteria bacterium]
MGTDLEEIKNRLNIVDVIGDYLRLEKAGGNWRGLCPFHNEKSPSFMVSEEKQIWHCFGCQKGGDVFSFVMEMEGLEFKEALKILAEKAGVELKTVNPKAAEKKNRALEILELATKFYEFQLWEGPGKTKILGYLRDRGLKDETIKEFRLGYAPKGWRNMLDFLTKRGYGANEIFEAGLIIKKEGGQGGQQNYYDRFRSRIMFPIAEYSGKVVGYSARVAPGEDESQAKYINSPESGVYHKSRILYGIDKAKGEIKHADFILLVEGNMDVIATSQLGIRNVVAISGTALTSEQVDILKRYTKNFRIFFDMDSAGEGATRKSIKLCLAKDVSVNVVELPMGKDAAELAKDDPSALKRAIGSAKDAMEYVMERALEKFDKGTAHGKRMIAENVIEILEGFQNGIEKSHWIKKLADELDVKEQTLTEMTEKATLRGRTGESAERFQKKEADVAPREKMDVLIEDLIGFMLVSKEVWKEVAEKEMFPYLLKRDELFSAMIKEGRTVSFDFDVLVGAIDREMKLRAEKIYFQKKFRLGLNNVLEEAVLSDISKDSEFLFSEISKEIKRERMADIVRDLKSAEERNDREASMFLKKELKELLEGK